MRPAQLAPLGGAVVGFTKTYKRERMDALVKAVDFEAERKPSEVADILIEETLRDPGAVEIGYKEGAALDGWAARTTGRRWPARYDSGRQYASL